MSTHSADSDAAQRWFAAATSRAAQWDPGALTAAKSGRRVSVVIPARDEAATIGPIVAGVHAELMENHGLVDELVVIDSDSSDTTATVAAAAGAVVHRSRDIHPEQGSHPGKGEALWKSQFVTTGDVLVFVDADLTGWGTHFVSGLLGPLLTSDRVQLVKGFYDRLLDDGSGVHAPQGGRVTELVARPLINVYWPQLSHVVQPLAGEWAIRRETFAACSVPVGYGVELATLLDVHQRQGLAAIAQVDLGSRAHVHQSVHDLGVMAAELMLVVARRRPAGGPVDVSDNVDGADPQLWQFHRSGWAARPVPWVERAPVARRDAPAR